MKSSKSVKTLKDLTGFKFNRLKVLSKSNSSKWLCVCDCGKLKEVDGKYLKNNHTKSCGCLQKELVSIRSKTDHTGKTFNNLLVIKRIDSKPLTQYLCRCNCGKEVVVYGCSLITNHTKSCGCLKNGKKTRSHKLYNTWKDMKGRCYNINLKNYKYYGERGIKVCERWKNSFANFLEDMGEKPSPKLSIDRINNDLHYSCGKCNECIINNWLANCRWATQKEQANNKR